MKNDRIGAGKGKTDSLCGVILCGGQSHRYGSDKALILIDGEPLIRRAHRVLATVVDDIVIAVGPLGRTYEVNALQIPDKRMDAGPLAGIEAAFEATTAERLFVLAVDLPLVEMRDLKEIVNQFHYPLTYARDTQTGRDQPLCSIWHRSLQSPLSTYLNEGNRSVMGFISSHSNSKVDVGDGRLINVNFKSDLPTSRGD
ncbi:MAG: molybdenum cofactor guanylyltransferase [Bacteroidetes bacterium]|nr:molybdenum cofactor guanylyltransferase [Bacteroidota bacterium]